VLQTSNAMSTGVSVRSRFNFAGLDEGKRPDNREPVILQVGDGGQSMCSPVETPVITIFFTRSHQQTNKAMLQRTLDVSHMHGLNWLKYSLGCTCRK